MMMKRNQIIITALVVMIAVAGYLNYSDSKQMAKKGLELNENGEIAAMMDKEADVHNGETALGEGEIGSALTMDETGEITGLDNVEQVALPPVDPNEQAVDANQEIQQVSGENKPVDAGEAVFVNTTLNSSYFVQAKLEREQARSKQKDILLGLMNDDKIDKEKRASCADAMLEIQKRIEKETAAEAMIEAKGFKEVYVRIDDSTVDVVVNKEALSDAEIAQIEDIVKRKTGMNPEQIRISPMKK